jgi:cell division protein FtsW (lipid II flippase)
MKMEQTAGRVLIIAGILLAAVGAAMIFSDKIPLLGKLPGDIRIERENFRFYVPIGTSILISVVLTVILWIISLLGRK